MKSEMILNAIGQIDGRFIEEAAPRANTKKKWGWVKWGGIAACLMVILTIGMIYLFPSESDFNLSLSTGNIEVKYIENAPISRQMSDLPYLTEEELFTKYDTEIFSGTIEKIRNIEINFDGLIEYQAIAQIKVDKVYRGDCNDGETVFVRLPCPIDSNIFTEDVGAISSMREGMNGIFMPIIYDETYYYRQNNTTLYFLDIAPYGFVDGERFAFLETDSGLIFAKWAYKSISSANSLDEIERYIIGMISGN